MFKGEIAALVAKEAGISGEDAEKLIEIPPDSSLGDYAFPCFSLAKKMKKSPQDIAKELAGKVKSGLVEKAEAKGPYLNFFIAPAERAEKVIEAVRNNKFWPKTARREKILVEYPSPNTNKPLHLGHVRNMVLGSAVSSILRRYGHNVRDVNLNNDRGIHICKSMLAYRNWGEGRTPQSQGVKPDHFVGDFYVRFQQEAAKDPELEEDAQEMLKAWERGDKEVRSLWEKMNSWALEGFSETYERYRIGFDKVYNESQLYRKGKEAVLENLDKFRKDETGAIVAELEKSDGLPDKVLLRADGTSIYMTQDIALTQEKIKDFGPDRQVWVVGNEQDLHFRQLFAILRKLGIDTGSFHHLSYGMVFLPEGRMKSREGKVVDADDILNEMERLAGEEIRKRHKDWKDDQVESTARSLAMAAIRFFMLRYDPARDFTFDPETSLSFEGDTGPYLQYTHARICSILRKAGDVPEKADLGLLKEEEEQDVLRKMSSLQESFSRAAEEYRPSTMITWLIELAQAFNTFYHQHQVLESGSEDVTNARLVLVESVKELLEEGLEILGIDAPEAM